MRKYLKEYVKEIDELLEHGKITEEVKKEHLIKIEFFQHERLIHLLVTLFYALFTLSSFVCVNYNVFYIIISLILLIFLIFYIRHYFFLENNVQYLYKQYDKMNKKNK